MHDVKKHYFIQIQIHPSCKVDYNDSISFLLIF